MLIFIDESWQTSESDPEKKHKVVSEQDVGNTYHANSILGFESSVPA